MEDIIPTTDHVFEETGEAKEATCTEKGSITYTCKVCKKTVVEETEIAEHEYDIDRVIKKATLTQSGQVSLRCKNCDNTATIDIQAPENIELSETEFTYDGKAKKPKVTVFDKDGTEIDAAFYSVSYSSNKTVGIGKVTVTFKKLYSGKLKSTFVIGPKSTKITKISTKKNGFTVKWKKLSASLISGYQIEYSEDDAFPENETKIINIKSPGTVTKTITKLNGDTEYFVRIRAYKTVKINKVSQKLYSEWSEEEPVITKGSAKVDVSGGNAEGALSKK